MERNEQIALVLEPLLLEQWEADAQRLMNSIEHNVGFIVDELSEAISATLERAARQQKKHDKGPITYLSFSLLLSNLLMGKHGFQVAAFDDRFFVDTREATADWRPDCIFSGMQPCFDQATAVVKQQIPRLLPYELMDSRHAFYLNYYGIATQVLVHSLPHVLEGISIPALKKADKVLVVTGLYMEKQDCIYIWE